MPELRSQRRHRWVAVAIATLVLAPLSSTLSSAAAREARLTSFWDDWLADVEPLLAPPEREAFEGLGSDRQRERFLRAFWRDRGSAETERWRKNRLDADQMRARSPAARRVALLFGKPGSIDSYEGCRGGLRPLQVWRWSSWHLERQGAARPREVVLVLVQTKRFDPRSAEVWRPGDMPALGFPGLGRLGIEAFLEAADLGSCFDPRATPKIANDLRRASTLEDLADIAPWSRPGDEWLERLRRELAAEGEAPLSRSRLEISYPGSAGRSTILRGRVNVEIGCLAEVIPGQLFDRVVVTGDLWLGGRLQDSFEVIHHVAGASPDGDVELDFYRRLPPGSYRLDLRVADRNDESLLRERREVVVPALVDPAPEPPGRAAGYLQLTRSEVVLLDTFPSVELLPVTLRGGETVRLRAITTGGPIAAVEFGDAGGVLATDPEPPYTAEVKLSGDRERIEAAALDPEGRVLARSFRWIERESRPFAVRFGPPDAALSRVPVLLSLPQGETLQSLECFDGRRRLEPSSAEPWSCPLPRSRGANDFLRVDATLSGGERVENVLFLGPVRPEGIEVRLVELYVSVLDPAGRPLTGLGRADFRLLEEGVERPLESVRTLEDLPMSVAILMDISASMGRRTRIAAESAQGFFEHILRPGDTASLLAFNHDLHRIVPFTADARELRHGAESLRGWGSTRLHDAIVFALAQYAGLPNRRALVVLSDGADVDSDHPFDQVLRAATQAGVAVYPVSLASVGDDESTENLRRLAAATGGSFFRVGSIEELDSVYRRIEEELRSQYLLVYRPETSPTDLEFRPLEVEVLRAGATTRSVHGYYP